MTAVFTEYTCLSLCVFGKDDLYVVLNQGPLTGVQKTNRLTKEPYYAFLSIPYAKPPLGEKRFKDPNDPLPWNGVFSATHEGRPCLTYNVVFKYAEGDEDCLHLNVYVPKATSDGWFVLGAHKTALLHYQKGESPVYFYNFALEKPNLENPKNKFKSPSQDPNLPGPKHGDHLKHFFYNWDKEIEITPEEQEIIWNITCLWVNFAKFGNPTPEENDLVWKQFKPDQRYYLEISNKFEMKKDLEKIRMDFWENLIVAENLTFY